MRGRGRTAAVLSVMAVLSGVTTLLSRQALGAEPTTLECITAYEDSVPLRKNHQLKAARAKLLICSWESCPADVRAECLGRLSGIDTSMPTVVFEAKDAAGAIVFAVKVKMDGELLAERLQGSALPIDPGEHTFTFEVAGRPSVEKHLLIFEGEKLRRERVEFEAIAAPNPPPPPATLVEGGDRGTAAPSGGEARSGQDPGLRPSRCGVGVAATGVGVAYGFVAMSRRDEASTICPSACPDMKGVNEWNDARSAGNIATGAFIVGAVGIASGVVVWLLARPAADGAPGHRSAWGPVESSLQVAGDVMIERRGLVAILAVLIPFAGGCNSILGIKASRAGSGCGRRAGSGGTARRLGLPRRRRRERCRRSRGDDVRLHHAQPRSMPPASSQSRVLHEEPGRQDRDR